MYVDENLDPETYGWLITKDHLYPEHEEGVMSGPGYFGPYDISEELQTRLKAGEGEPFKMYDSDGEIYYEGLIIMGSDCIGFEPLDDYGMPNAGCCDIRYRNEKTGEFETL